jgi:hypothetical protein
MLPLYDLEGNARCCGLYGSIAVVLDTYGGHGFKLSLYDAVMDARGNYIQDAYAYDVCQPLHVCPSDRPIKLNEMLELVDQCVSLCQQMERDEAADSNQENEHAQVHVAAVVAAEPDPDDGRREP